jgi:WD40 repeat protein
MESPESQDEANGQRSHAFDIFLSYSRVDSDFADRLEKALEGYKFPKSLRTAKRTLNVFRDVSDIEAAEDYHRTIDRHIKGSGKLIVVCSPAARKSTYVADEISRFIETHAEQDIIPVLLRGKANNETDDEEEKAFPEILCRNRMPLAANFLACDNYKGKLHKGQFRNSFYSILAAIHGLDRRRLEQIDEKARARRRALALGTASVIIMILSVALVYAVISQRKAVAATKEAIASAEAAKKAEAKALDSAEAARRAEIKALDSAKKEKQAKDDAVAAATKEKQAKDQALAAAKAEEIAKNEAIAQKKAAEQLLYTADLNLAPQAYATGNAERSIELLEDLLPPKREDIRGFPWYYLNGLYHRELKGFEVLARDADSSAFSPDGTMLATDTGGTIKLWDVASRKLLTEFKSEDANSSRAPAGSPDSESYSSTLAFSPSNRVLAIALANGAIKLWDIVNQKLTTLDHSADGPPAMAFASDGRLATGVNQTYKLWNVAARTLIGTFEVDKKSTDPSESAVVFSHDDKLLAYLQGTVVKVRDVATQEILRSLEVGYMPVLAMAFSADDKLVRIGTTEGVDSFSVKDTTSDSFKVPTGSGVWINNQLSLVVAFSPDGLLCATGEAIRVEFGGGVKLWDVSSHELLVSFGGSTSNGEISSLNFSPDSKTLVVGGTQSSQFYDARVQRNSVVIPAVSSKTFAAFFSDSKRFTIAERTKASSKVTSWDIAATESPAMKPLPIDKKSVVAISPNGKTMAVTNESSVELWDVAAQRVITTANTDRVAPAVRRPQRQRSQTAAESATRLTSLAFSPKGDVLAIGVNGGVQWWEITPGGLSPKPEYDDVEGETVFGLAFSADGKFLTALSSESSEGVVSVRFWDAASRRSLGNLGFAGGAQPTVVAVSADSKTIALGFANSIRENNAVIAGRPGFSRYMETQLWDVSFLAEPVSKKVPWWEASDENFRKRFLKGTLEGGSVAINAVAWSSDNKTLATGGTDGTVRLWNRNSYQRLLEMPGQVGEIHALAFSPDNETLLGAGAKGIQLWYAPRTTGNAVSFVRKANPARTVSPLLSLLTGQSSRWFDLFNLRLLSGNDVRN